MTEFNFTPGDRVRFTSIDGTMAFEAVIQADKDGDQYVKDIFGGVRYISVSVNPEKFTAEVLEAAKPKFEPGEVYRYYDAGGNVGASAFYRNSDNTWTWLRDGYTEKGFISTNESILVKLEVPAVVIKKLYEGYLERIHAYHDQDFRDAAKDLGVDL